MQLRNKFTVILFLLSSIPLLVLLFGVVDRMEDEVLLRVRREVNGSLDKMADELTLILDNQKAVAQGLARVPTIKRMAKLSKQHAMGIASDAEYQRATDELEVFFLNYQHVVPSIQALRFIDTRGKTLVKVKEGKPIEAKILDRKTNRLYVADQSQKNFFKEAMQAKSDVVMSDFELGQVSVDADFCPAMVRYSVLVRDEIDQVEGVLVVNMWGSRLDSTVEASMGGITGRPYIVELSNNPNREGIYLYNQDNRRRFADQLKSDYRLTSELKKTEWQRIRSSVRYGTLFRDDGRMLFYRKMEPYKHRTHTQWLLVIETSKDVVFASVNNMRKSILVLLGFVLVLSTAASLWAALQLSRPIQKLADIITRYADGDVKTRYKEERSDAIGIAGKAFNYLVSQLEWAKTERDKAEHIARQSERLATVGQMAAGIGHEINNPLMNIMSLASLIEKNTKEEDEQSRKDLRMLYKEGERCARVVQGILSFARKNQPEFRTFDMSSLLHDTALLLHHRIDAAGLRLELRVDSLLVMDGDMNQLQQVLVNVLLNAVQATRPGGNITIEAYKTEGFVHIEITDSGAGIAEDILSKVFDPFFTTKPEGGGTGLGLSVSYGIIKEHHGGIELENNEAAGLRVHIVLPLAGLIHVVNQPDFREAANDR